MGSPVKLCISSRHGSLYGSNLRQRESYQTTHTYPNLHAPRLCLFVVCADYLIGSQSGRCRPLDMAPEVEA